MMSDRPTRRGRSHGEISITRKISSGRAIHHGGGRRRCKVSGVVARLRLVGAAVVIATVMSKECGD